MEIEAASEGLVGKVLASRYRVEARLGHGAMGTVYRARHVKVGRAFAIKVLHHQLLTDDKTRRRFAREAELAGVLHHANVVSVVDVGETHEGQSYLVMEYAEGRTLYEVICESAPMPARRVIPIVRQLCDGLQHAHDHGLIHRDLKTENVLVDRAPDGTETVRIVDFGIAILRDDTTSSDAGRLTSAGLVLGTPHYMAPEHATGGAIDHRIDLFALGVMCFEMLTGVAPFDGDGVDVARANLLAATPVMSVRVPNLRVDPLLEAFTRKLMMKSRDDRPPTAKAARELLDLIERDRAAAAAVLDVALDEHVAPLPRSTAVQRPWPPAMRPPSPLPAPLSPPPLRATVAYGGAHVTAHVPQLRGSGELGGAAGRGTATGEITGLEDELEEVIETCQVAPLPRPRIDDTPVQHSLTWHGVPSAHAPPLPIRRMQARRPGATIAAIAAVAVLAVALVLGALAFAPGAGTPGGPSAHAGPPAPADPMSAAAPRADDAPAAPPAMPATGDPPAAARGSTPPPSSPRDGATASRAMLAPLVADPAAPAAPAVDRPAPPARFGELSRPIVSPTEPAAPAAPTAPADPTPAPPASPASGEPGRPDARAGEPPARDVARPSGKPIPLPAAPDEAPSPRVVAERYGATGKQLKSLDVARGSAATSDLWPLYLRIRINDVIADPVKCGEADALLRYLDDQIAARSRTQSSSTSSPAGSRDTRVNPDGSAPPSP